MKIITVREKLLVISIIILTGVYQTVWASSKSGEENLAFNVYLNDTLIGNHEVSISRKNGTKSVVTEADFEVRFMFVPVYSYNHESREFWKDGCLEKIRTTTNDNGDEYYIKTSQSGNALQIQTNKGPQLLQGCVRTYAYWDPELLNSERLLNTQTGEYQQVSVADHGMNTLTVNGITYQARKYRLVTEDTTIDLWYSRDMRWLALETETKSGDRLRYLPEVQTIAGIDRS